MLRAMAIRILNIRYLSNLKPCSSRAPSASNSRQWAILILVESEKLQLDVPVITYFNDLPKTWKQITVRHLLTHTSGLGDYPDNFNYRDDYAEDKMF